MKKYLITVFFIVWELLGQSQIYRKVIDKNFTSFNSLLEIGDGFTTDSIIYVKDSIFSGKTYNVLQSQLTGINYLIRFNESNSIGYQLNNETEYVIYNLDLGKGDTFKIYFKSPPYEKIISVDSVFNEEDRKHVAFSDELNLFNQSRPKFEFIEGVGTNLGCIYQNSDFPQDNTFFLLCVHNSSGLTYINEAFMNQCRVDFSNFIRRNTIIKSANFRVYPIPTYDFITITIYQTVPEYYELYNNMGCLLDTQKIMSNPWTVNLSAVSTGMYFLRIHSKNVNQFVRIIKL